MHCCGVPAEILGLEETAAEARTQVLRAMETLDADELLVACPQCQATLRDNFPDLQVSSVWELLAETWDPTHRLEGLQLAVHDPCRSRHDPEVHAAIRTLVRTCGAEVIETEYSHERTRCCGFGGKVELVDPGLFARIAGRAAGESDLPMLTYCTGCRGALRGAGADALHILDLLMTPDAVDRARSSESGTAMRLANRLRAKWSLRRMSPPAPE
jgi:Fe-S oxidoreductase